MEKHLKWKTRRCKWWDEACHYKEGQSNQSLKISGVMPPLELAQDKAW